MTERIGHCPGLLSSRSRTWRQDVVRLALRYHAARHQRSCAASDAVR